MPNEAYENILDGMMITNVSNLLERGLDIVERSKPFNVDRIVVSNKDRYWIRETTASRIIELARIWNTDKARMATLAAMMG